MTKIKNVLWAGLAAVPAALATAPAENFIVTGGMCAGIDCSYDESFTQRDDARPDLALKLRENNTRVAFLDTTSAADDLQYRDEAAVAGNYYFPYQWGNAWWLTANDSANEGRNLFAIQRAATTSNMALSDGSAIDYECIVTGTSGPYPIVEVNEVGLIPEGEPAELATLDYTAYFEDGTVQCAKRSTSSGSVVAEDVVLFGRKATRDFAEVDAIEPDVREVPSYVVLGTGAEIVPEAVSVGSATEQRRLSNLAEGINELDLVTRGQLRKLPFEAQVKAISMVNNQLDALEAQVSELESRYSVPVFTSAAAFTFLENEFSDITLTATDSSGDDLTFGFKAGQDLPVWLNLSAAGELTGTPVNESGRVFDAIVEVTDGYSVVEQTLSITVLDAEVTAVSMAAGLPNGITYVELNAVDGVDAAIESNNAKYQAAIQARTGADLDTPEEIAALVASVNSVPVYTGQTELLISNASTANYGLSAADATNDVTVFALSAGNPDWVSLTLLDNVQTLVFAPSTAVTGVFPVALTLSDEFANTVPVTLSVKVNTPAQAVILGDAVVGEVLSVSVSDVNGTSGASFTYSWFSGADAVSSTASYELSAADVGNIVSVSVFFTDDLDVSELASATSDAVITREENAANTIENSAGNPLAEVPELEDYQLVGVDNVSEEELTRILPILNRAVAYQTSGETVDTVEEIEALIDVIMEGQDDDGDGLPNLLEGDDSVDTDGDGVADRHDVDADSDGIRDNLEYGLLLSDLPDMDSDGVSDIFDAYDELYSIVLGPDENLDGVRDDLDTPAEFIAFYQSGSVTPPGVPVIPPPGVPVIPDPCLTGLCPLPPCPAGVCAAIGVVVIPVVTVDYNQADVDEDGVINSLDLDSDNDGVPDLIEAGLSDANDDGVLDDLMDLIEAFSDLPDTDSDGTPDLFELFSNGTDRDLILAGIREELDEDNDGRLDSQTDVDMDGLMDVLDNAIGAFGSLKDFDGDGIPNHLDEDDDGDGIPDSEENDQYLFFTGMDADADGIDDGVDAEVNGEVLGSDANGNGVRDDRELRDLDGDGIADYLDLDADNDGIPDINDSEIALPVPEAPLPDPEQAPDPDLDSDGDGIPDRLDVSNNPGTDVEAGTGGSMSQGFWWLMVAILAFTARTRRQLMAVVLALAAIAPAHAENFSVGGGVGFTRFSPDLNIEPTEEDYIDASALINAAWHISSEWSALVQYTNLGEASVNTAAISYSAWSVFGQYRPAWAMSESWSTVIRLGSSVIDAEGERGLNVESNSEWLFSYGLGADYQVSTDERVELMFTRFSGDAQSVSAGYRILF
jgi:BMFP domain-containing protein YqiC